MSKRRVHIYFLLIALPLLSNCGGGGSNSGSSGGSGSGSSPVPGNRTAFVRTDDTPSSVAFDSVHNLIYAALPDLAQVDVINPRTGQVVSAIPVPDAQGVALSPDGTRVLVSGLAQQVVWIDTSSEQIVQRNILPQFQPPAATSPTFLRPGPPMIMANGKILFPNGIIEWNPVTGQYQNFSPAAFPGSQTGVFGVRSADGTKVIFASKAAPGGIGLFDSASDSFTATEALSVPPFAMAANPNGTQFVIAVLDQPVLFLDSHLNTLGEAPVAGVISGMVYSADGQYLYMVSTPANVPLISKISATTFQLLGQAPAYASAEPDRAPRLFVESPAALDSTGMIFGIADHGVALDDSTDFQNVAATAVSPTFALFATPAEGPLNASTPVGIITQSFSALPNVWFGGLPGTNPLLNSAGQVQVTAPATTVAGSVDVKILSPDGTEANLPEGFTYGAVAASSPTVAAAPSGGATADFFGYGYGSDLSAASTQVQIGGRSANVTNNVTFPSQAPEKYPFPLDHIGVTVPSGTPGPANVRVTSEAGTATISGALHYVHSVEDYSSSDTFQFILYDSSRQRVYLSAGDHIDVFSAASSTFMTPIVPPTLSGQRQIVWLALTPDGSKLLAANLTDNSVAVINPDNPATAQAVQIVSPQSKVGFVGPSSIAPTSTGVAFITTMNTLEGGADLNLYQLNLSTLQVTTVAIPGNDIFLGLPALLASATNGSTVVAFFVGNSGGTSYIWTAASGAWTIPHDLGVYLFDGAVSGDGNIAALDQRGGQFFFGTTINVFDSSSNLLGRTGVPEYLELGPSLPGMKLDDSGGLAYVPVQPAVTSGFSAEGVDIYGVQNNNLLERVVLSEQFPVPSSQQNALAIDPTGQNIFLITNKGLTVVTLDSVPLSIGSVTPSSGAAGTIVTIRGSGLAAGVTAQCNGTAATVKFVDAETLQLTIPTSLAIGGVSITLTNPGSSSYTLADGFTVQ